MYHRNEQQPFYHTNYYLIRHDYNENIMTKLPHIARKSTNTDKIPLTTNFHLTKIPTQYQNHHVEFYVKRMQNPMRLIAALICTWITIAFMTNSKAFAYKVTTTDYTSYPTTLKMAKITMKMMKTALKKPKPWVQKDKPS